MKTLILAGGFGTRLAEETYTIVHRLKVTVGAKFRPKMLIIEHMEVDLVFSRLFAKNHLRIMDIGSHHGEFLDIFEQHNHPNEIARRPKIVIRRLLPGFPPTHNDEKVKMA